MLLRQNHASYDIKDRSGMVAIHYAVDGGMKKNIKSFEF